MKIYINNEESIIELEDYAITAIKKKFAKYIKSKGGDIEFDDRDSYDRTISFLVRYYPPMKNFDPSKIKEDYFTSSIDFQDANSESMEDAKYNIDSSIEDFMSEFFAYILKVDYAEYL